MKKDPFQCLRFINLPKHLGTLLTFIHFAVTGQSPSCRHSTGG